jgi:hypothetical protein
VVTDSCLLYDVSLKEAASFTNLRFILQMKGCYISKVKTTEKLREQTCYYFDITHWPVPKKLSNKMEKGKSKTVSFFAKLKE